MNASLPAVCHDCGRPYGDEHGFPDLLVPDDVWLRISPHGGIGGLLCPSCICKRVYDAGLDRVEARFTSGPLAEIYEHPWTPRPVDTRGPRDHRDELGDPRFHRGVALDCDASGSCYHDAAARFSSEVQS